MRRKMVLGVGLAGILGGSAFGQVGGNPPSGFATGQPVGRPSPAPVRQMPPPVGGFQPAGGVPQQPGGAPPAAAVNPAALVQPADLEMLRAVRLDHPLLVRPEHGNYFICVKSYSRPADPARSNDPGRLAGELAESLAREIQVAHPGWRVFLYEYVSEEKKAQAEARARAIRQARAFEASLGKYRQESQLRGMEFLGSDQRVHYQTFKYRDQVAVLVGGFATEQEALKAHTDVKKWEAPKDKMLMDGGAISGRDANGQPMIEKTWLNPFKQSMVVPNPTVPRPAAAAAPTGLDPFVVKLNNGRPYSLLKATKGWTLVVRTFSAPVTIQSKEGTSGEKKMGQASGADALAAGAEEAEALAKALRDDRMKPRPFDAFVLHTRNGSMVTVGQFDGPNDPALLEMRRLILGLRFNTSKDEHGSIVTGLGQSLFGDNIVPIPVPRP